MSKNSAIAEGMLGNTLVANPFERPFMAFAMSAELAFPDYCHHQ